MPVGVNNTSCHHTFTSTYHSTSPSIIIYISSSRPGYDSRLGLYRYVEIKDALSGATPTSLSSKGSVAKYTGITCRRSWNGDFAGSSGDSVNMIKSYVTILNVQNIIDAERRTNINAQPCSSESSNFDRGVDRYLTGIGDAVVTISLNVDHN